MIGKFNEPEYDGLVLRIPSFFIEMNGLQPEINKLYEALQKCDKSMYLPDHLNNLHELENLADKRILVAKKKEQRAADFKKREDRQKAIINGDIYDLIWVKESHQLDHEYVRFNGEIIGEWKDYLTDKLNVKTEFVKKLKAIITDIEAFKMFANENCAQLAYHLQYCPAEFITQNFNLYCTSTANLGISYERLNVKFDWRISGKNYRYSVGSLIQFDDGCLAIHHSGNVENAKRLEGYKKHNMTLIK